MANLLTSYYLMAQDEDWPPEGVDPPDLLWATVVLFVLPISSFTMWWAGKGSDAGKKTQLAVGVTASVGLASLALLFRSVQISGFDIRWDEHACGSILWAITGFHFTHVVSVILGTAAVRLCHAPGRCSPSGSARAASQRP